MKAGPADLRFEPASLRPFTKDRERPRRVRRRYSRECRNQKVEAFLPVEPAHRYQATLAAAPRSRGCRRRGREWIWHYAHSGAKTCSRGGKCCAWRYDGRGARVECTPERAPWTANGVAARIDALTDGDWEVEASG